MQITPSDKQIVPFTCDRTDKIFIIPTFLLGFAFSYFVLFTNLGIGVTIFTAFVYLVTFTYAGMCGIKPSKNAYFYTFAAVIMAIPFAVYGYSDFKYYWLICLMFMMAMSIYKLMGLGEETWELSVLNSSIIAPFCNMDCIWRTVKETAVSRKSRNTYLIFLGIIAGLPISFILIGLLSNADAAFSTLINNIVDSLFANVLEYAVDFIIGIPFAMAAYGMLYSMRHRKKSFAGIPDGEKFKFIPSVFTISVMIPICLVFIIYLFSQFAYFFSAFQGLLPDGFTYAEYARRGFFELCVISVVNLLFITVLSIFSKGKNIAIKAISLFISTFSIVLICTALSKMFLYMSEYGLTPKRMLTSYFMLILLAVFILLIIKLIWNKFKLMRICGFLLLLFIITAGISDFNTISLRWNINAYENGTISQLDVDMTYSMSQAVIPYLIEISKNSSGTVKNAADEALNYRKQIDNTMDIKNFNIMDMRGIHALDGQ